MIPNTAAHNNSMSPVILPCVVTMFNTHWTTIDINTIPKTTLIKNRLIACKWYFLVTAIWIIVPNIINDTTVLMLAPIMPLKRIKMILSINLITNPAVIPTKIGLTACCACNNAISIIINDTQMTVII